MSADDVHRAVAKISGVYGEVYETTEWIASTLPRKLVARSEQGLHSALAILEGCRAVLTDRAERETAHLQGDAPWTPAADKISLLHRAVAAISAPQRVKDLIE